MKKSLLILFTLFNAFFALAQAGFKAVEGNSKFAFELYNKLDKTNKNIFLSPYSISSALAMTYAGARSTTASEMEKVMHFTGGQTIFHADFTGLMNEINSRNGEDVKLSVANRLFGDKRYKFKSGFIKQTDELYKAPLEKVDFVKEFEKSRSRINAWVEEKTNDKIKDLLKKDVIKESDSIKLVLVNAIYFYGDWAHQFDADRTRKGDFYTNSEKTIDANFMSQTAHFEYMENNDLQAIRLPYKGNSMSMEVFLPKEKEGLDEFEKLLTYENYQAWDKLFTYEEVNLAVPKFKMTTDFMLGSKLMEMGMKSAFGDGADFSGMSEGDLKISEVIHKAFIDVSEKGTEAAAATAVVMAVTDSVDYSMPKNFRADHPFFFIIRDNKTRSILFMGRFNNPA
ncbi:MAG TPA: serpin family protein [Flavobacteriales bacterium]|nr:serpin family protein [Flavobacteriales bacterium]